MLPPDLPDLPSLPGLETAARYVPAQTGLDIGGDWYDAFALPDGSLGFAIGDVQGHDVEAAAFMGQVRTGLRAVAGVTTDPGDILGRANNLLLSMSSDAAYDADADELAAQVIAVADLTGHTDDAAVLVLRHDGGPYR
ncbi:PP2C family protein-serine/threonine phosphatase [Streptomyces lydicus]|uniref:PP2C family protein-serine/threonine phosphatase n=1 Tax=Streptomyces lydicus TaxID=47763 RepID=UPI0036FEB6F7